MKRKNLLSPEQFLSKELPKILAYRKRHYPIPKYSPNALTMAFMNQYEEQQTIVLRRIEHQHFMG